MTGDRKPKFFYGYVVVAAAFGIQAIAWGIFDTYGVFFKPFLVEFGWSRATISGASSLAFLLHGLVSIVMGGLSDRFGPRIVMVVCGLFFGLGHLLMSQVNAVWQLYLFYSLIVGAGLSGTDVVLLSTIARWFIKKRGMISGMVKAGTGVGMFAMPLVASGLISAYTWRTSYIILGIVALVFIISGAQFLRRDPREMGQLPEGGEEAAGGNLGSTEGGLSLREAVRTRQFWMLCPMYLAIVFCAWTLIVHIVPHAVDLDISATSAASVLSILGGASIVGRVVMGSAGDRIGNRLAMTVCFLILGVSSLWLQWAKELWMLYLFAVVYGFAHGGFFAVISPRVAGLFGTSSHGIILGIVIFCGTIGGSIGAALAGYIFDITGSYQLAFLLLVGFAVTGLILNTALRPITTKGRMSGWTRST